MSDFPVKDFVKGISFERATFPKDAFGKEEILAGVVSALRTKKREKIYPVGNLRCTTLPIRGQFQHTSTWNSKTWRNWNYTAETKFDDGDLFYLQNGGLRYSSNLESVGTRWLSSNGYWYADTSSTRLIKYGADVWTDGTDTYYSGFSNHYVWDKDANEWREKTWNISQFYGRYVWSDCTSIYLTSSDQSYVLVNGNWEEKTFNVPSGCYLPWGNTVWSDGYNIYASSNSHKYVLDGDAFVIKEWDADFSVTYGRIWSDGTKVYHSAGTQHHVLVNGKWKPKTWNGATNFSGSNIWTDLTNIYIAKGEENYVLR